MAISYRVISALQDILMSIDRQQPYIAANQMRRLLTDLQTDAQPNGIEMKYRHPQHYEVWCLINKNNIESVREHVDGVARILSLLPDNAESDVAPVGSGPSADTPGVCASSSFREP